MNTKESLIASARQLLWERGYVGTSPKAILDHSGVGQGSLYHHFSGKPELASVAIARNAEELTALAAKRLAMPGSAIEKISGFLQRERDVLRGCQVGRLAQDPEVIASDLLREPLADAFAGLRRLLADVLTEGVARREIRENVDVAGVVELILATLQGGYVLARAENSEAPFRRAIGGLQSLLATLACEASTVTPTHTPPRARRKRT